MQAREEFGAAAAAADERWMREALRAAREAARGGEVPVGACVVAAESGGRSASLAEPDCSPHAERDSARKRTPTDLETENSNSMNRRTKRG